MYLAFFNRDMFYNPDLDIKLKMYTHIYQHPPDHNKTYRKQNCARLRTITEIQ